MFLISIARKLIDWLVGAYGQFSAHGEFSALSAEGLPVLCSQAWSESGSCREGQLTTFVTLSSCSTA
jgi:hypothetical protein